MVKVLGALIFKKVKNMKTFIITVEAIKRADVKISAEEAEKGKDAVLDMLKEGDLSQIKFDDIWDSIKITNIKEEES